MQTGSPVKFQVDYPDHSLNRLSTFFRPLWLGVAVVVLVGE